MKTVSQQSIESLHKHVEMYQQESEIVIEKENEKKEKKKI